MLESLERALKEVDTEKIEVLAKAILRCKSSGGRVFLAASGRSLNILRGFACRLAMPPISMVTHALCGSTFPPIRQDDLLIVCSSTGYTQYVTDFAKNWREINQNIILITSNNDENDPDNTLWRLVDQRIFVKAISKKYKERRRQRKLEDKYDIKEDFSKMNTLALRYETEDHFLFEMATKSLLEAVCYELVNIHQSDR